MSFDDDHPAITKFLRRLDVVLEPLEEADRLSVLAASQARVRNALGPDPSDEDVEAAIAALGPVEDIADPVIAAAGATPTWVVPFVEREEDMRRDRFRGILGAGAGVFALVGVVLQPYAAVLLAIVALVITVTWLRAAGSERGILQAGVGVAALALAASIAVIAMGVDGT